jgi:hypothetical protein
MMLLNGPASAVLVFCGVTDNINVGMPGFDQDPTAGVVQVLNCALAGGGTVVSGSAREVVQPASDRVTLSNLILRGSNPGVILGQNTYPNFQGNGFLRSGFSGTLENQPGFGGPSIGGEFLTLTVMASTFDNNPVQSMFTGPAAGTPLPIAVVDSDTVLGKYSGAGVLTGRIAFNAGGGQQFRFASSQEFVAEVVPEPSGVLLVGVGIGALGLFSYRRLHGVD